MLEMRPVSPTAEIAPLAALLRGRRVVVLAGAGISTESGIPDYRGPDGKLRSRTPLQYNDFMRSVESRTRYWSRAAVGWRRVSRARPNAGHGALARLEEAGVVRGIITQNVDGLHQKGGSRRVIELHGSLARVVCTACAALASRAEMQEQLERANAEWLARVRGAGTDRTAPDGDAEIVSPAADAFHIPDCARCAGVLKPDVVFFGENVPRATVDDAWRLFAEAEVLLVVGSSLMVFSGRRFVYRACRDGVPVAIANLGPTRADDVAALKVEGRLGVLLTELADELLEP